MESIMEIERKFLVKKDELPDLTEFKPYIIEQCFINDKFSDLIARVRKETHNGKTEYFLNIKSKGFLQRMELKFNMTEEEYNQTKSICGNRIIRKSRYKLPHRLDLQKIMEIDIYEDFDFITCEYEAETLEKVQSLVWEDYFEKEVTDDPNYSNFAMSLTL